jgi:hypothetical protein
MKALFKRIDRETMAWGLDAGCRHYISNNKNQRNLRRKLRRMARKKINKFFT